MVGPVHQATVALLLSLHAAVAMTPAPLMRVTTGLPSPLMRGAASLHRNGPARLSLSDGGDLEDEGEEESEEESGVVVPDDWDIAWSRMRLEGIASEWWQELRLEALEGLPVIESSDAESSTWLQEAAGIAVGLCAFCVLLNAYLLHSGGIVIVPSEDTNLVHFYNFAELGKLEPHRLLKLGLPTAPPPIPTVRPLLRLGGLQLLLSADGVPPIA